MKLLSNYHKEMKIAARGFYFYIEIIFAVIILLILLFGVKEESVSNKKEFLFYEATPQIKDFFFDREIQQGSLKQIDDTEFKLKELQFTVTNTNTLNETQYTFDSKRLIVDTYEVYDKSTGKLDKTVYILENEKDLIHLAYQEKKLGATIVISDTGDTRYKYFLQGYETEKLQSLLKIIHNEDQTVLETVVNSQIVEKLDTIEVLNNRENLVPIMVVFMGSLMGFFIVIAYIFLDKEEGVIKAFVVTPQSMGSYLFSKIMVIITTVLVSSSIITIPIMGAQPNYLLFYILLIISTFTFSAVGLVIASFFDTLSKTFGALYVFMLAMMLPAFSYIIPSFDPLWLRFFPTYPMLQGMKEIISVQTDIAYVLTYSAVFLVFGIILFLIANIRFKKTLTV